jgi:hypothetical protein
VSGADLDAASALIDRALRDDDPEMQWRHKAYMELTQGMVDYRSGNDADAVRRLRGAIERPVNNEMLAINSFFLAMAHHRLGEQSQAESLYRQGVEIVEDDLAAPGSGDLGGMWFGTGWTMWVHAHAAHREAAALIQPPAAAGVSTNRVGSPTQASTD